MSGIGLPSLCSLSLSRILSPQVLAVLAVLKLQSFSPQLCEIAEGSAGLILLSIHLLPTSQPCPHVKDWQVVQGPNCMQKIGLTSVPCPSLQCVGLSRPCYLRCLQTYFWYWAFLDFPDGSTCLRQAIPFSLKSEICSLKHNILKI